MVSKSRVLLGIFAVYVSYLGYVIPVPDGTNEPHKLRADLLQGELVLRLVNTLDYVGLLQDYEAIRWLSKETIQPKEEIQTLDTLMGGVPVRVYTPHGIPSNSKVMVFYHGGGWIFGNTDTHDEVTSYFAKEANMVVVSVEYRLNPEYSKRDGLDDCIAATKYLIENAAKFGVDPERVVVAGDSAGGNYAAVVALYLRDQQFSPMPKLQLLIYPVVQGIDLELPSYQQNPRGPLLSKQLIDWFMSYVSCGNRNCTSYFQTSTHVPADVRIALATGVLNHDLLPNEYKYPPYKKPDMPEGDAEIWPSIRNLFLDPYSFPMMAKDHSGLPETYMFTAQFDPLRDEGYLYVHKLRQDGVKVTHYNCPHGWHGMIGYVRRLRDATDEMTKMVNFINERL